ncbi:MAG: leucine-rich repeat protein [Tannerella sp.]|jgi:uncharacterized repeat protein (TIGR02543 family)|nr:leucine-rich repeat protein [Tannerella sp.]
MRTKFTKLILLVAAVFCSATGFAQGPWTSGSTTATLSGNTLTISGTGAMGSGAPWSGSFSNIKTVIVESGVTSIGLNAFSGATALTSVSLPASVTTIGNYAFNGTTALTYINLPGVTSIGDNAFQLSGLESVSFAEGLTSIGSYGFFDAELTYVILPASVTSIGTNAFRANGNLGSVSFLGTTPSALTISGNAFLSISPTATLSVPPGSEAAYEGLLTGTGWPAGGSVKGGYWVKTKVSPDKGGKASPASYFTGDTVDVKATPNPGYTFEHWTIDNEIVSTSQTYTVKIKDSDVTVTAHFKQAPVDFSPKTITYNGLPKSVTIEILDKKVGEITAVYYDDQRKAPNSKSKTPPTAIGEYKISVDIAGSADYPAVKDFYLGIFAIVDLPDPNPVSRAVYLSATPGITTSPATGRIYHASGSDFVFTASSTTPGLVPFVTTEPAIESGAIKYELNEDGRSYTITIKSLRQELQINLDFVTANATVGATKVWASDGQVYIATVQAGEAQIYNILGRPVKTIALSAGETIAETLPTGIYIVTLNGGSYKVLVGK